LAAIRLLEEAREKQLFITGLIYVNSDRPALAEHEQLADVPLARLSESHLRPRKETLALTIAAMK
jgi:2-oxoglutarate ferredoxin oxidoreductase subunit beta